MANEKEKSPAARRVSVSVQTAVLPPGERLRLAQEIVDGVLHELEENVDPVLCKAEGMLHVACESLREARGYIDDLL